MYGAAQNEKMIYFVTAPIDFGPGECLVFSPDYAASTGGAKIGGNSVQYDANNLAANVLSASIPTGQNNFHINSGFQADPATNLAAKPITYGVDHNVNSALAYGRSFVLKKANPSGSISYSDVKSSSCATIETMLMDYNGKKTSIWWDVYANNAAPVNNATFPGFEDYTLSPNRNPPRLWYSEGRLRWLDETDEQQALGQQWGKGAGLLYHNPVIGNFNVRANAIYRSPFCFYDDWTRYAPGPSMIPWATPRLGDARQQLPYGNGRSYGSPFGLPADWSSIKSYAMFDVPQEGAPLFSLACLQHVQMGYEGWQPTYVIGNSIAEPRAQRDLTVNPGFFDASVGATAWSGNFAKHTPGNWSDLIQGKTSEVLAYDISYSVNQMLWDRFFMSGLPYSSAGELQWNVGSNPLPNPHMVLNKSSGLADAAVQTQLSGGKSFDNASYFLMNEGAFNVNSTSVEAWRALFSTLNRVARPDAGGGSAAYVFSRLLVPRTSVSTGPTDTAATASKLKMAATWEGVRVLTDDDVDKLATRMVEIVKARGPFLSLTDFVNRRLAAATSSTFDDESFCGPLQAAIEKAQINGNLQRTTDNTDRGITASTNSGGGTYRPDVAAYFPYKSFGAPGYLTQADMLQTIGSRLAARGDTFVVRSYGDARDAAGNILARAWCEATVQRVPDYVVSGSITEPSTGIANNPMEPVTISSTSGLTLIENSALLPHNKTFGRRFELVDFRWLKGSDI